MSKVIYVTSDRPTFGEKKDSIALFETGQNTGNLLFYNALCRQIKDVEVKTIHQVRDEDSSTGSTYILSVANAIRPGADVDMFRNWAKILEKKQPKRVILAGIGAQAKDFNERLDLPDGLVYFLKYVADNSHSIGVRGYYSANVLSDIGINNVSVIGCPSLYTKCDRDFKYPGGRLVKKPKVAVHSTPDERWRKQLVDLYLHASKNDYSYIAQNEIFIMEEQKGLKEYKQFYETYSAKRDYRPLKKWFINNSHIFYNTEAWSTFIKQHDFCIGTRIHGCVIALLNGVRSVILPCDTRTQELADLFSIPKIDLEDFKASNIMKYYENMDSESFNFKYKVHYNNYKLFLENNGLDNNL